MCCDNLKADLLPVEERPSLSPPGKAYPGKAYPRLLVDWDLPDRSGRDAVLNQVRELCRSNPAIRDVVILLEKKSIRTEPDFKRFVGPGQWTLLKEEGLLQIDSQRWVITRCETMHSLVYLPRASLVIACWADMKLLDYIDGLSNVAGVIVLPRRHGSVDAWEMRWHPDVIGRAVCHAPPPLITDRIVEQALTELTREVNLADGLAIPYHRHAAKTVLRVLRIFGHREDPARIKDWAITRGWRLRDAEQLSAMADTILTQTTRPRIPPPIDPAHRYAIWKRAVERG